jgi:hypothetical protein
MGAVYKRKRRSCAMCKPHKVGWSPKRSDRGRQDDKADREEIAHAIEMTHNARGRHR